MKKTVLLLATLQTLACTPALAADKCANAIGNITIGKVTLGCMIITGSANFTKTELTGPLVLKGKLEAMESTLMEIQVAGPVSLTMTSVNGKASIVGPVLEATKSSFAQSLDFTGDAIRLNKTTTRNITINSQHPVTLSLTDVTVNGDIRFTHGKGTVENNHSSIHGQVLQK